MVCDEQTVSLLLYSIVGWVCKIRRLCLCYAVHYYYAFVVLDILVVDTGSLNSRLVEVTANLVAMDLHTLTRICQPVCALRVRPEVQRVQHW